MFAFPPQARLTVLLTFLLMLSACGGGGRGVGPTSNAPVFSSGSAISVSENITGTAYAAGATDADGDILRFELTGGMDQDFFTIDAITGFVNFKISPNFELANDSDSNNTYIIEITVNDEINFVAQTVTITVTDVLENSDIPAPTISSFTAAAAIITLGDSVDLTAVFANGVAEINNGVGAVLTTVAVSVAPTSTTTYTLTASNAVGFFVTATVTVTVVAAPLISRFASDAATITAGSSVNLNAVFSNGAGVINNNVGTVISANPISVSPNVTTRYTLTVSNATGLSVTSTLTIVVVAAPRITRFVSSLSNITAGAAVNLTAVFVNGTASINNGVGTVLSGTAVTVRPTQTTTYTLSVSNAGATAVTANVTVTVLAAPVITSFTSAATTITVGTSVALTAVFANGTGTINNGVGAISSGVAVTVSPTTTTMYILTVTNAAGVNQTASLIVNVVSGPGIASFTSAAPSITLGDSVALTAVFSSGTGTVDNGVGTILSGIAVLVSPTATTTYTLTVSNAAGLNLTSSVTVTVITAPVITSFSATSLSITAGTSVNLNAVFSNGTGTVDNAGGAIVSGGSVTVSPIITTLYTLSVTNAVGSTVTATVTIIVVAAPTITNFSSTATTITLGESVDLTGVFANGAGLINNGVGNVVSGVAVAVNPTVTTIYTLTVTNSVGSSVNRSVSVTVVAAPGITTFITSAANITLGNSAVLTAIFADGTGSIDNGIGNIFSGATVTISPTVTTVYTLTITNATGAISTSTVTVTVVPAPSLSSFTSAAATITFGSSVDLTAVFVNGAGSIDNGIGGIISATPLAVTPTSNTTYTLTVTNAGGTTVTATLNITVIPAPTISSFSLSLASITVGSSVDLSAVFANGSGVINNGVGTIVSPATVTVSPTTTTTYSLTVSNTAGTAVTSSVTVTVVAAPSITSFSSTLATITAGSSVNLTAIFANGSASINNAVGNVASGSAVSVSPINTTTYTLTVSNTVGTAVTATVTVTVIAAPVITSFVSNISSITAGSSVNLTAVFANGSATIDNAVGSVVSGVVTSVSPTVTTTYTLSVSNTVGTIVTAAVTITVVTAPIINSFSSASATITSGQSVNVTAVFSNGNGAINNGVGVVTSNSAVSLSPTVTTNYILTVSNGIGVSVTSSLTITVVAAPSISSFTSALASITLGSSVDLTAVFANGGATINNGVGTVVSGTPVSVAPTTTTTYTLTVSNTAGSTVTATVTITVVAAPSITSFSTSTSTISVGGSVNLTALFANGTGTIDNGVGAVTSGVVVVVAPITTTTYTLTVSNGIATDVTATVTVTVVAAPTISSFVTALASIPAGSSVDLTATFANGSATIDNAVGAVISATPITVSPLVTTTYTLTVTNAVATSVTATVTVTVTAAAVINSFTTSSTTSSRSTFTSRSLNSSVVVATESLSIVAGASLSLTAVYENGTGSIDNGVGSITSGTSVFVTPTSSTRYTLTVTSTDGSSVTSLVDISVVALDSLHITNNATSLEQVFQSSQTNYSATLGYLAQSLRVTASTATAAATLTVNSVALDANNTSDSIALSEGLNTIIITVAVADGTSLTYYLDVTRQSAATFAQQAYIKASNTDAGDQFGYQVAIDDDTMVVGARFEASSSNGVNSKADNLALNAGAAYVFTRNAGIWSQQAYLKASNADAGDAFGSSVSLSGDTIAIGALGEASNSTGINSTANNLGDSVGAVYVFIRTGTIWSQQAYIKASNSGDGHSFGRVSLSGDSLAVSSVSEDSDSNGINSTADNLALNAGAVYVFTRTASSWTQQAYIKSDASDSGDLFGNALALSGDTLVVAAEAEDSSSTGINSRADEAAIDAGAVYVFTRSATTWSQQAYIKSSNPSTGDLFGSSIALDGNMLAVGATSEDSSTSGMNTTPNELASSAGAVYVYTRSGTTWTEQAYIKASNSETLDNFGFSIALSGDTLAVGTINEDSSTNGINSNSDELAPDTGAVYLFIRTGTTWTQDYYLKASNSTSQMRFGQSVSLTGDSLAIGARLENSSSTGINSTPNNTAPEAGSVYIFK